MDTNRAGRTREPTGDPIRAGDGMPIFGAGMRTDTIESPEGRNHSWDDERYGRNDGYNGKLGF